MHKHLHTTILAKVERSVFIHGLRLVMAQLFNVQCQRLLVALNQLWLCGVLGARDARWQHIVYGLLVVVLFNVYRAHAQFARLCGRGVEHLVIHTPFATHQVEVAKAQHDGALKACEEHAHEADRGEIVDAAHLLFKVGQRYTKLVPRYLFGIVVTQLWRCFALVYHIVASHHKVFGADRDVVLIIFFVFVKGVVLVNVFNVGRGLV